MLGIDHSVQVALPAALVRSRWEGEKIALLPGLGDAGWRAAGAVYDALESRSCRVSRAATGNLYRALSMIVS